MVGPRAWPLGAPLGLVVFKIAGASDVPKHATETAESDTAGRRVDGPLVLASCLIASPIALLSSASLPAPVPTDGHQGNELPGPSDGLGVWRMPRGRGGPGARRRRARRGPNDPGHAARRFTRIMWLCKRFLCPSGCRRRDGSSRRGSVERGGTQSALSALGVAPSRLGSYLVRWRHNMVPPPLAAFIPLSNIRPRQPCAPIQRSSIDEWLALVPPLSRGAGPARRARDTLFCPGRASVTGKSGGQGRYCTYLARVAEEPHLGRPVGNAHGGNARHINSRRSARVRLLRNVLELSSYRLCFLSSRESTAGTAHYGAPGRGHPDKLTRELRHRPGRKLINFSFAGQFGPLLRDARREVLAAREGFGRAPDPRL